MLKSKVSFESARDRFLLQEYQRQLQIIANRDASDDRLRADEMIVRIGRDQYSELLALAVETLIDRVIR